MHHGPDRGEEEKEVERNDLHTRHDSTACLHAVVGDDDDDSTRRMIRRTHSEDTAVDISVVDRDYTTASRQSTRNNEQQP